jgi:nucleoside-diphosphate-sugar epimerase
MTIAVTGATGYVGRSVVARCLAAGATVRALVRDPQAALPAGVERVTIDLAAPAGLDAQLGGADVVVHCAAEQRSPSRARHQLVNVGGTRAVLEAAVAAGVRRVIHLSSIAVYSRREPGAIVSPDDPVDPFPELREPYAWSKIGAESWVALHRRASALDVVTLRLGIVYGRERDVVARVSRRLAGPLAVVAGSPGMLLPLVHVDDVAEAVWRVAEARRVATPTLHVVGPETPTQRSYLARRAAHRRERMLALYVPLGLARALAARRAWADALARPSRASRATALAWCAQHVRYDMGPTERTLGWMPRITIDDGLRGPAPAGTLTIAAAG